MDESASLISKSELNDLVKGRASVQELVGAAKVLQTRLQNLVPLKELAMRTVVSSLPKLDPDSINNLPSSIKAAFLELITKSIPRDAVRYVSPDCPELGLDFASDGTCVLKKIVNGCTFEEKDLLMPDLSIMKQLISSDLQDFDFNAIERDTTVFSEESEEIWKCLASSAPNLTSVKDLWKECQLPRPGHLIVEYLAKFPNLRDLELATFRFSDEDIRVLSTSCPNLRSITLTRNPDLTEQGLHLLQNLPLLKKIIFGGDSNMLLTLGEPNLLENAACHQKAFELLPNLKSILVWDDTRGGDPDSPYLPDLFFPKNPPQPFMLQEASDIHVLHAQNITNHFPELTKVYYREHLPLERLPRLRTLDGLQFPEDYPVLQLFGSKLVEIIVDVSSGGLVDLGHILVSCPNLEKLHLRACFLQEEQQHPVDPARLKLKDLQLVADPIEDNPEEPRMIFWDLLLAPNLQKVCLLCFLFTEPKALLDSALPFLQQLTYIETSFEFKWPTEDTKDEEFPQVLDVHNELLSGLIRNCPKLETIKCDIGLPRLFRTTDQDGRVLYLPTENHTLILADVSPEWRRIPKQMEDVEDD
ncbi:uncharacterized protein LOC132204057 [Neocloeon triangulifer]|uniref:uncharacterized protein LOC132204057 n=1 Tax=Neocloeon triangulifer TaxID=2078957 RepID=UPI00286EE8F8|nr:uncharacterized protein LOC132204057 [Neocloeon triangulifer]